jgi:hypothetical protein
MARGATHLCASGSREVHKVGLRLKDNREALMEYTRCPLDNYIVRWTTTLTATLFHAARPEGGAGAARAACPFSLAADNLAAGNSWDRNPSEVHVQEPTFGVSRGKQGLFFCGPAFIRTDNETGADDKCPQADTSCAHRNCALVGDQELRPRWR